MTKLHLQFNESMDYVRLKLVGGGTIIIDAFKQEHRDVLCKELVNYINHEKPSKLEFDTYYNNKLVNELLKINIKYDNQNNKLHYND